MATTGETLVAAGVATGDVVELRGLPDPERVLSAAFLRSLCIGPKTATVDPRGLRVEGARILEPLDLTFLSIPHPLHFIRTEFAAPLLLDDSRIPELTLGECDLSGISARGLRVEHNLLLAASNTTATVTLDASKIGGHFIAAQTTFRPQAGDALSLVGAEVAGDLRLDDVDAVGAINLAIAQVGGALVCSAAAIVPRDGYALRADGIHVKRGITIDRGFVATGEVLLSHALVEGEIECGDASLTVQGPSYALRMDRMELKGRFSARPGFSVTGGISMDGIKISGDFVCRKVSVRAGHQDALRARYIELSGSVDLADSRFRGNCNFAYGVIRGNVFCMDARFLNRHGRALDLSQAEVGGVLGLNGVRALGETTAFGAKIGSHVQCSGAQMWNPRGYALQLGRAEIGESVLLLEDFAGSGGISMVYARIGGDLVVANSRLRNRDGPALAATNVRVAGSVYLTGTKAFGTSDFAGAVIGQDFMSPMATLAAAPGAPAIHASRVKVTGSVDFSGTIASGGIWLPRVRIGDRLVLRNTFIHSRGQGALILEDARIAGTMVFAETDVDGVLDLRRTSVESLLDDVGAGPDYLGSWSPAQRFSWPRDGFTYRDLAHPSTTAVELRVFWLTKTGRFDTDAWQQLIDFYDRRGLEADARRVRIARETDRVLRAQLGWPAKVGLSIVGIIIGYGYRPLRAAVWALAIIGIYAVVVAKNSSDFVPAEAGVRGSPQAVIYAADTFLPIIDLREADRWIPIGALRWADWTVIILGWVLSTIFVAGFTAVVRK